MNRRVLLIIVVVFFVIIGGIVALAVHGDRDNKPSSDSSSSFNPAIYVGAFLPIFVALAQMQRPEYPAEQVFYQLRHAKIDAREKRIIPYLSQRFRSSGKLRCLLQLETVAALRLAKSEPNDPAHVTVWLRDESEYTCQMVARDKQVDGSGNGKWVIDGISGPGLN